MRIGFGLVIVSALLAGGCQSEQQTLADFRQQLTDRCNTEVKAKGGDVAPGFDTGRFCTCSSEKVTNGRNLADLEKMGEDKAAVATALSSAGQQCAAEQMQAVAAAQPAAPAAAPAEAAEEAAPAADATE